MSDIGIEKKRKKRKTMLSVFRGLHSDSPVLNCISHDSLLHNRTCTCAFPFDQIKGSPEPED